MSNNNSVSSINYFKTALPSSPSLPIYSACSQQLSVPPPAQPGYVARGVQSQTLMLSQGFASSARASDVAKVTLLGRIGSEPVERQVGGSGRLSAPHAEIVTDGKRQAVLHVHGRHRARFLHRERRGW